MKKKIGLILIMSVALMSVAQAQIMLEADFASLGGAKQDTTVYVSPEDSIFNKAETDYHAVFRMKGDPGVSRDSVYACLMQCFNNFSKSLAWSNDSTKSVIKERIRSMHTLMLEGGYFYYQARRNEQAYPFVKQFLLIPEMPIFSGEQFRRDRNYQSWVVYAATEALRAKEFQLAAKWYEVYLESGEKAHQERAYAFLAIALGALGEADRLERVVEEGLMNYPENLSLLESAINLSLADNQPEKTKEYLGRALALDSTNVELIFLKGQMYDSERKYVDALKIYESLQAQYPEDPRLLEKRAYCYYNIGAAFINESNMMVQNANQPNAPAVDMAQVDLMRTEGRKNLNQSIVLLNKLLELNPKESSYLMTLADAYSNTGNKQEADRIKRQMNSGELALDGADIDETKIPNFNIWAEPIVKEAVEKWSKKDDFETTNEFKKRVNNESHKKFVAELIAKLKGEFISEYASRFNLTDFTLKPYDADHETFKIQTRQGDIYLQVPRADGQAQKFQRMWGNVQAEKPKFDIDKQGNMVLTDLVFTMANGTSYLYDARKDLSYGQANVTVQFGDITAEDLAEYGVEQRRDASNGGSVIVVGDSDVDRDVPRNKRVNENTYALIFCNEKYDRVGNVEYANADGNSFYTYCKQTLGVPTQQIKLVENATMNEMIGAVEELKYFMKSRSGNARVFVYYSGHGLPDPNTGDGYLVPRDAFPSSLRTCYKLSELYAGLSEAPSRSVTVFLDACFSGSNRDGSHVDQSARGVVIKSKAPTPQGNMVVFSACSGEETAYPLSDQKHGLFTYHLLKKLQETKGRATYGELAEYIRAKVSQISLEVNKKPQTPTIHASAGISASWEDWRLDREE